MTFTDLFCAVIFVNIFLSFIIFNSESPYYHWFLVDFEDKEDVGNCRLKKIIKRRILFFWGKHAAGKKATAGNGWKNGMGMTVGTEYMK